MRPCSAWTLLRAQEGGEEEDPYPYQEPDGEDESA